ncbi:YlbL family protein [Propionibacteriaceae bacterium G1746]|uniref:YlbL family protein n=1 Tax=Aestuariimicrobium sp. G57 TaxID=3418485 RepID=UPI003C17EE66
MPDRPPSRPESTVSPGQAAPSPEPIARESVSAPASRRQPRISQQTLTAVVSSGVFFALTLVLALAPVPYVGWRPGGTVNLAGAGSSGAAAVQVQGLTTTPLNGELRLTTVSQTRVDSRLGLAEAMYNYASPYRDVLPRRFIYPPGKSVQQVKAEEVALMGTSQSDAVVAALRAAGQPVKELPMVTAVTVSGPALNKLLPGDMILKVDAKAVQTLADVTTAIRAHAVGEPVVFTVDRGGTQETVTVTTVPSPNNPQQPQVGIRVGVGYQYTPKVSYGIDPDIVGPSAGVMFAVAIYDLISPDDLLAGRKVAGTGEISPSGNVAGIGAIQQKIRGAEKAGATIFLVPADNCRDLSGVRTTMQLIKVGTLREAIGGLQRLKTSPDGQGVPRC